MGKGTELAKAYVQIVPSADGISDGLKKVMSGKDVESASKDSGSSIGKMFASAAGVAIKAGSAAITAAAGGIMAMTKAAVDSYGDYEQLVGGVDTLFEESSWLVQKYADDAYKTAGMSANTYMETVTGFSASLLQSLDGDTKAAAEKANLAITDMSDNANKMGTSMESITNAYQGFAKQNYTMLDNLKLGYGGTKEEMERLLEDASAISGIEYDISSYGDIVDAIHIVQNEMGITGTTAREASTTIQGSIGMMQASWDNLLTGLADSDADLGGLIGDLVDSVKTVAQNMIPVVEQTLLGIGQLITTLAPVIAEELPPLIESVLPELLNAVTTLISALASALPTVVSILADILPGIMLDLIGIAIDILPLLLDVALKAVSTIAVGLASALPELIPSIVLMLNEITSVIISNLDLIIGAAIEIIGALVLGINQALPELMDYIPELVVIIGKALIGAFPIIWNAIVKFGEQLIGITMKNAEKNGKVVGSCLKDIIDSVKEWVSNMVAKAAEVGLKFVSNITNFFKTIPTVIAGWLAQGIVKVAGFVVDLAGKAKEGATKFTTFLKSGLNEAVSAIASIGTNIVTGLWNGIDGQASWIKEKISGFAKGLIKGMKSALGIHSPSRVFRDEVGKMIDMGLAEGISDNIDVVNSAMDELKDSTYSNAIDDMQVRTNMVMTAPAKDITQRDRLQRIESLLEAYLPGLANTQIVMDTGLVVGQMAPDMDIALGRLALKSQRGVRA